MVVPSGSKDPLAAGMVMFALRLGWGLALMQDITELFDVVYILM